MNNPKNIQNHTKTKFKFLNLLLVVLIITFAYPGTLSEINLTWADTIIATVGVGDFPQAVEYNPGNNNLYVANMDSDDVSVIDSSTNDVVATVDVGNGPQAVEYNPNNNNMYVVAFGSNTVSVIQTIALKPVVDEGADQGINSGE